MFEKVLQNIPFLRILSALVAGIVIATFLNISFYLCLILLFTILIGLILANNYYKFSFSSWFGFGIQMFFIAAGFTVYQQYNQKPALYENGKFLARVNETPTEKPNSFKSNILVTHFYRNDSVFKTNENVLVYFEKDEKVTQLRPGTIIAIQRNFQLITNNGNPYEFDYKKYLERQKIYRQVYLNSDNWEISSVESKFSLVIKSERIRDKFVSALRSQNLGETEFEILSALILGYKKELEPEVKQTFSATGASHVLAVSGLHVGIVFWSISLFFGFLKKSKRGKVLYILFSIGFIWFYAFLTGLSPSVLRASAMVTVYVIGDSLKRQMNIYNTLALSASLLLLYNPNNLFDVGFQLSYSAVFGIVFLQPRLQSPIITTNKVQKFFWSLLTVSVAAQLSTMPITLYYFNQFPVYFWLTNLFIIPATQLLIPLGMVLLLFQNIPFIWGILSTIVNFLIHITYKILTYIAELPYSVSIISIDKYELTVMLFGISLLFIYLVSKKVSHLRFMLFCIILFFGISVTNKFLNLNHTAITVYNNPENTFLQLKTGRKSYFVSEKQMNESGSEQYIIRNLKNRQHLKDICFLKIDTIYEDKYLLVNNGKISFQGKNIFFNHFIQPTKDSLQIDYLIDTKNNKEINRSIPLSKFYIFSKTNRNSPTLSLQKSHSLRVNGAFMDKW